MKRTIIIGAGVAGLATAALLAKEGHEVFVFEKNERVGGRVGTIKHEGFRFDTGPSWYLMPSVFEHFFELLGTSSAKQLDLRVLDPGYKIFFESQEKDESSHLSIPYGIDNVAKVFESVEPNSAKKIQKYLRSAKQTKDMAEQYFLYNTFTKWHFLGSKEILRSIPALLKLLFTPLTSFTSANFKHTWLRQILEYPAIFLGTDPRKAPAMYHLMSALDLDEGVQYPMGGFWHLLEKLQELAVDNGAKIITKAEVTRIVTSQTGKDIRVEGIEWLDENDTEQYMTSDFIVSAADLHHTENTLLDDKSRTYGDEWWADIESGPGAVLVMLGVSGKVPELEHHSLFFTKDWDNNFDAIFEDNQTFPNPASIYVCKPSATDPSVAPEDAENLFILIPTKADENIGSGGVNGAGDKVVEQLADQAIDQVDSWASIGDLRERIIFRQTIGPKDFADDYNSWRGGMLGPSHVLRQSAMFRAKNVSKKVRGLFYAGGTTSPGVGVPMCLISAELVLKHIRNDHSVGPTKPLVKSSNSKFERFFKRVT